MRHSLEDGIKIEVEYADKYNNHMELQVSCSSGYFAGSAYLYVGYEVLFQLGQAIRGFPVSLTDVRQFTLGNFDDRYAGGGIRLQFLCADRYAHTLVKISIRADTSIQGHPEIETATFFISVEPASIDDFVAQLDNMVMEVGAVAHLRQAI